MKKEDIMEAMSLVDDKYIVESMTPYKAHRASKKFTRVAALAACLVLVVGIAIAFSQMGMGGKMFNGAMDVGAPNYNDMNSAGAPGDKDAESGGYKDESAGADRVTDVVFDGSLLKFTAVGSSELDVVLVAGNVYYTAGITECDGIEQKLEGREWTGSIRYEYYETSGKVEYTVFIDEVEMDMVTFELYIYVDGELIEVD